MTKNNNEENYNGIKCYCCGNRNEHKNYVFEIDSKEYENWKKEYIKDLKDYEDVDSKMKVKTHYQDPDRSYYYTNKDFFDDLTKFLNKQEDNFVKEKIIKEKKRYTYSFEKDDYKKGICVRKGNEVQFYLRSDQFGFSVPTPDEREYPYDIYYKTGGGDKCRKIAAWISYTRTIGGSFLWPLKFDNGKSKFHTEYNRARGGRNNSRNNYYMQDRVDLTLYEVSCFYNANLEVKTKLSTYINKYKYSRDWFDHFGNFSNFIKFFCFESFTIGDEIMDMTRSDGAAINATSYKEIKKHPFFNQPQNQNKETMEYILGTLSKNVLKRSRQMQIL